MNDKISVEIYLEGNFMHEEEYEVDELNIENDKDIFELIKEDFEEYISDADNSEYYKENLGCRINGDSFSYEEVKEAIENDISYGIVDSLEIEEQGEEWY